MQRDKVEKVTYSFGKMAWKCMCRHVSERLIFSHATIYTLYGHGHGHGHMICAPTEKNVHKKQ